MSNYITLYKMKKRLKYLFNPLLRLYIVVRRFYKSIGIEKARKAIESATAISKYRTENLAMYGEPYRKTMEFARLELGEKVALFKYEFYKALFRL